MEIVHHRGDAWRTGHHVCHVPAKETQAESNHEETSDQPKSRHSLLIKWLVIIKSDKVTEVKERLRFPDQWSLKRYNSQMQGLTWNWILPVSIKDIIGTTGCTSVGSEDKTVAMCQCQVPDFDGWVGLGRRKFS